MIYMNQEGVEGLKTGHQGCSLQLRNSHIGCIAEYRVGKYLRLVLVCHDQGRKTDELRAVHELSVRGQGTPLMFRRNPRG